MLSWERRTGQDIASDVAAAGEARTARGLGSTLEFVAANHLNDR